MLQHRCSSPKHPLMFRFENPLYLYALAIIPLLALLHYATNALRRRRQRRRSTCRR